MVVSLNHPFWFGFFHYKPTMLGYPHLWKPPQLWPQKPVISTNKSPHLWNVSHPIEISSYFTIINHY